MMEALLSFHLLRPEWLLALLPVAVLTGWMQHPQRRAGSWLQVVDARLAEQVLNNARDARGRWLRRGLATAWTLAVIALAGPSWQQLPQPAMRVDDGLVVVMDLSRSMTADDQAPSRIERARLKVADLLRQRPEGTLGLVAYAGDAHVVVPLTDDTGTVRHLVQALEPEIMPVSGSRPERALPLAQQLFTAAGAETGTILLITDGVPDPRALLAEHDARYPVSILGMGSEHGATLTIEGDQGPAVTTPRLRRDSETLARVANRAGGRYAEFSGDDSDLHRLLPELADASVEARARHQRWLDTGPWWLLALLPLVLLGFRRGLLAGLLPFGLAGLLLAPGTAEAGWRDWFWTPDQQGHQALLDGDPEQALQHFEAPDWRAATLHRLGRHQEAAAAFQGNQPMQHYNRGTALAHAGEFQAALEAFELALDRDPQHASARHNRDLVRRILEQQRPDSSNEQSSQRDAPDPDHDSDSAASRRNDSRQQTPGSRSPRPGEAGEGTPPEQGRQQSANRPPPGDADSGDAEPSEGAAAANTSEAERQQALEQWLRRIPEDPAALLERKFRYEAEQRQQAGQGVAPGDPPW